MQWAHTLLLRNQSSHAASYITHHTIHITHRTSYIIHHTSYIIHHISHITHHTSYVIHHRSYVIHHTSHIVHHTSYTVHHTFDPLWRLRTVWSPHSSSATHGSTHTSHCLPLKYVCMYVCVCVMCDVWCGLLQARVLRCMLLPQPSVLCSLHLVLLLMEERIGVCACNV